MSTLLQKLSDNGSRCPECNSPDIEIRQFEDGSIYLQCNNCGNESGIVKDEILARIVWLG